VYVKRIAQIQAHLDPDSPSRRSREEKLAGNDSRLAPLCFLPPSLPLTLPLSPSLFLSLVGPEADALLAYFGSDSRHGVSAIGSQRRAANERIQQQSRVLQEGSRGPRETSPKPGQD